MKTLRLLTVCLAASWMVVTAAAASPMDELVDQFGDQYEALIPAPNSSVGTDYPIRQVALGSYYTNLSLRLLYEQNQSMIDRQEELLEKYDQIIELNRRIVDLLGRIADQSEVPSPPGTGGN